MSQAAGLEQTVKALALREEHGALVELCRGLAAAIDEDPSRAALWREYRPAVESLIGLGEVEDDDAQAELLELVRTPVGNKKAG